MMAPSISRSCAVSRRMRAIVLLSMVGDYKATEPGRSFRTIFPKCGREVRQCRIAPMLFMVIETFQGGDPNPVGERFRLQGRMLPEGVVYLASWMEASGARCFQIMEAPDR